MEEYQQELFNDLDRNKKARGKRFRNYLFIKKNIRFNLSYEQVGLFIILFVVLLSVVFTLGVERGKRLNFQRKLTYKTEPPEIKKLKNTDSGKKELFKSKSKPDKKDAKGVTSSEYFTVQVVTYKRNSLVEDELKYLKRKGYAPFVINSGKLKHICIGKFEDKDKAKSLLKQLRQRYKDCFIKKVK